MRPHTHTYVRVRVHVHVHVQIFAQYHRVLWYADIIPSAMEPLAELPNLPGIGVYYASSIQGVPHVLSQTVPTRPGGPLGMSLFQTCMERSVCWITHSTAYRCSRMWLTFQLRETVRCTSSVKCTSFIHVIYCCLNASYRIGTYSTLYLAHRRVLVLQGMLHNLNPIQDPLLEQFVGFCSLKDHLAP